MRYRWFGLIALCLLLPVQTLPAAETTDSSRQIVDFDQDWKFAKGEQAGAQQSDFDASQWQSVSVPHDWAIAGPFDQHHPASGEGGFLPSGVGWYRKSFPVPESYRYKRVFIEFDGVMAHSQVWINGHLLGQRPNGYVTFRYDLTEHLNSGTDATNLVAVRTDTSEQVASRWYTGSGIYRHVRLLALDPIHFDVGGVFAAAEPTDDGSQATLRIELAICNEHEAVKDVIILTALEEQGGAVVQSSESSLTVEGNQTARTTQTIEVKEPKLWGVASPNLYSLHCKILSAGTEVDAYSCPVGIRKADFRSDTGFWLNGENIKLNGVCLHHCAGALGAAVPLSVWEYRLTKLKTLGVNAIRTAHNPVAPEFLDLCDSLGLLVMDEFFDCWTMAKRKFDYHRHFNDWAHRDLRDTILRDRNHPSVILYSVGNEIRDTHKPEHAKQVLQGLVDLCHETDPTRPVTQGLFRPNTTHDYDNGLADILDVIGTNYRDLELLQAWRDNPGRKIVGTEQGHDRKIWLACRDNPQHSGQFLWTGIDYLGESRKWPITSYNSGLLDRTGRVVPRGYERQSWWTSEPMVRAFRRIAPTEATPEDPGYETVEWKRRQVLFDDWTPRNLEVHTETVEVSSNCEEVELLLNDESLGTKSLPDNATMRTWQVPFAAGKLSAIGRNGGQIVARHDLQTAGPAHRIELTANRTQLTTSWDDVAMIEARIVDEAGVIVPRARNEITFGTSAAGKVIAVDNGSIVSHEPFQATKRKAYQGHCIAIVRATEAADQIVVTASADGLQSAEIEINSQ